MSQDIDLFSDDDAPVEFSGVSESQSSSSPGLGSQHSRIVQPPLSLPQQLLAPGPTHAHAASSTFTPQKCPVCKRVLKTLKGFNAHMESHAKKSSALDCSVPAPLPTQAAASSQLLPTSEAETFTCPDCYSVLRSKSGFLKHQAKHKLEDVNKRVPDIALFKEEAMTNIISEILEELMDEPSYEDDNKKINFVSKLVTGNENWEIFILDLTDFICGLVLSKQTKLMPANQYQEAQKKLNIYLNENGIELRDKLLHACEEPVSLSLPSRLVFRIAFKLLKKVQVWGLKKMRSSDIEEDTNCVQVKIKSISDQDKVAFRNFIGDLLRDVYRKGVRSQASKQTNCIKEVFVDGQHPLSSKQFLNKNFWFSGDENCIVLSDRALTFFETIEYVILPSCSTKTTQDVLGKILMKPDLLQQWYHLTSAFFSEDDSLLFMRELVICYLRNSLQKEEEKLNRAEEKTLQATAVALRTNLNRNYVMKDTADEMVE